MLNSVRGDIRTLILDAAAAAVAAAATSQVIEEMQSIK
jgi:hypothetical protein